MNNGVHKIRIIIISLYYHTLVCGIIYIYILYMDDDLEDLDLIQDNIFGITDEGIDMTAMTPMPPSLSRSSSSDVMSEVNETDRRIRIVHISDTHNNIPDIHSLQPANIFIHTGLY